MSFSFFQKEAEIKTFKHQRLASPSLIKMGCRIHFTSTPPAIYGTPAKCLHSLFLFPPDNSISRPSAITCYSKVNPQEPSASLHTTKTYHVNFQALKECKLGISRYPDFTYNAEGGKGTADVRTDGIPLSGEIMVSFDVGTLYIPPLTSSTTKFLGLPLPPFLRIDIVPEFLDGSVNRDTGKVDLDFRAKFWFSIGNIYRAPPLIVKTKLTSDESKGSIRGGKGERLDGEGRCRLVGVAAVDPIDDILIDSFLSLPTECLAVLNAKILVSDAT